MLSPVKFLFLRAPAFAQSSRLAITVLPSNVSLCPATYQAGYLSALAAPVDRLITSDARERRTGVDLAVCRHLFSRLEYGIIAEVAKYDQGGRMSLSVRFYLFADDSLQRISQRLMQGLAFGKDAMPQYAGTKQKAADVVVEIENGKPIRIAKAEGNFLTFDEKGQVHKELRAGGIQAIETFAALERSQRQEPSTVVDLAPKLKRGKWERDNRWTLSKQDLDLISDDIWKRKRAASPKVQQAKGVVTKPPPITFEAKEAIREIQTHIFGIDGKIEHLTEPALKGFAFEARRLAKNDFDNALWRGAAEAADRRREILARRRTGSGVWYASVDVIRWDQSHHSGQTESFVHEKCSSKKEAEEAARRLLAENAKYFSAESSVEARVACDLEWDDAASGGNDE
jgi:hypothetical protein